jgi:hypothetical protein
MASSITVGKIGIFQPFMLVGAVLATIGAGLVYRFDLDTGLGEQIGYQLVLGFGVGLVVQLPIIIAGALSTMKDKAVGLSVVCGECGSSNTARFVD